MEKIPHLSSQIFISLLIICVLTTCKKDDFSEIGTPKKPTIYLNETELTLEVEKSARLVAYFDPSDAENKAHTWSSSNSKVATVDEAGLVTGISVGEAEITAKALAGGSKATCKVTIVEKVIPVTGITISRTTATVIEGDTIHLFAKTKPENATDKAITWSSSDTEIATVDEGGIVTAVKEGIVNITATTNDGNKQISCKVTVRFIGVRIKDPVITDITSTSAKVKIEYETWIAVGERGCEYYEDGNPQDTKKLIYKSDTNTADITDLKPSTKYIVKNYVKYGDKCEYSMEKAFTTILDFSKANIKIEPKVIGYYNLVVETAKPSGVNSFGLCWGDSPNPKVSDNYLPESVNTNTWDLTIDPLKTCYIRAYHKENNKIIYDEASEVVILPLDPFYSKDAPSLFLTVTRCTQSKCSNWEAEYVYGFNEVPILLSATYRCYYLNLQEGTYLVTLKAEYGRFSSQYIGRPSMEGYAEGPKGEIELSFSYDKDKTWIWDLDYMWLRFTNIETGLIYYMVYRCVSLDPSSMNVVESNSLNFGRWNIY